MDTNILLIATSFRNAIEACPRKGLPASFERFPRGSCGDASLLLGTHLIVNGIDEVVLKTGLLDCERYHSHAWLQVSDLVIDITVDQFDDFDEIIVQRKSRWHQALRDVQEEVADFRRYDAQTVDSFRRIYAEISKHLTSKSNS